MALADLTPADAPDSPPAPRTHRIHPAWWVAAVAFLTAIGAAGFRSTPGVLIEPLHDEFGWPLGLIGTAVSVNLVLFGLTAPFSAALMERLGVRRVVAVALVLVSLGSLLPIWMTSPWPLILSGGVLVGLGTGTMSMSLVATVTGRWFVKRRGLVTGVLTAAGATGQLALLPLLAWLAQNHGWRSAAIATAAVSVAVVPVVLWRFHSHPSDLGVSAYGAPQGTLIGPRSSPLGNPGLSAIRTLREASRHGVFWLLVGSFAVCGMSTNGLVGTHFIPAAHDHGMPMTTAASLLALVGVFDIVGTIFSGWLTDRVDSRALLGWYYLLRGLSLFALPSLFAASPHPSMLVFVLFYGLDWVATVPPTVALCRELFGEQGTLVFGWVFAGHQVGAGIAASVAGVLRTSLGDYDAAWLGAGALCLLAAGLSVAVRPALPSRPVLVPA